MKNDRREFLRLTGLGSLALLGGSMVSCASTETLLSGVPTIPQSFNMSGYAAPKIETVRIGFIGLGMRGPGGVTSMAKIAGVEIKGLCDIRPEMVDKVQKMLVGTSHKPDSYSGTEEAYKEMVDRDDIDLIYIATPWALHVPMAVYAMEAGKHVAVEVPAAKTVEECWQLVETSERTKKHCMMLENCCYDFFELLTLNMARQGYFGEVIHGEGAYLHDLLDLNFNKDGYYDMWRLRENQGRNGNLYPTHGLGPICQIMNVNRGDKMEYLSSTSSDDYMMYEKAKELAAKDSFFDEFVTDNYRGNVNTTSIKTTNGRSIMIQHDVTSHRPYSRIHLVQGTKAIARKWPLPGKIAQGHHWFDKAEMKALEEEYTPEIVKKVGAMAKKIGGHGGMDFMMRWRLIDCLRNGLPLDQDVYDAASWSVITPLSEMSVANNSQAVEIPDFTNGAWKTNAPVSLSLEGGGTTKVLLK